MFVVVCIERVDGPLGAVQVLRYHQSIFDDVGDRGVWMQQRQQYLIT